MLGNTSIRTAFMLVTVAAISSGCGAGPQREAAAPTPYPSMVSPRPTDDVAPRDSPTPTPPGADLPTNAGASTPPQNPTDSIKKTDLVVGVVTQGGSGPCYGLQTDDGKQYALYSGKPLNLTRGTSVKVHTKPALVRIYCGPGTFLEVTALAP